MTAKPIPEGYQTLTPNLTLDNGLRALTLYENGYGPEVLRKPVMSSKLIHSESFRCSSVPRVRCACRPPLALGPAPVPGAPSRRLVDLRMGQLKAVLRTRVVAENSRLRFMPPAAGPVLGPAGAVRARS
jgi:hypothetical protein